MYSATPLAFRLTATVRMGQSTPATGAAGVVSIEGVSK